MAGIDWAVHGASYATSHKVKYASIAFENFSWASIAEEFLSPEYLSNGVDKLTASGSWAQDVAGGQLQADALLGLTQSLTVLAGAVGDIFAAATGIMGKSSAKAELKDAVSTMISTVFTTAGVAALHGALVGNSTASIAQDIAPGTRREILEGLSELVFPAANGFIGDISNTVVDWIVETVAP